MYLELPWNFRKEYKHFLANLTIHCSSNEKTPLQIVYCSCGKKSISNIQI